MYIYVSKASVSHTFRVLFWAQAISAQFLLKSVLSPFSFLQHGCLLLGVTRRDTRQWPRSRLVAWCLGVLLSCAADLVNSALLQLCIDPRVCEIAASTDFVAISIGGASSHVRQSVHEAF